MLLRRVNTSVLINILLAERDLFFFKYLLIEFLFDYFIYILITVTSQPL